jgi:ASC-1-like (ASCH) protein
MSLEKTKFDRLFVPLSSNPYNWFESGRKEWELRKYGRQYNELHVRVCRLVELSKGYSSKNRLWGHITSITLGKDLEEIFTKIHYSKILPEANSKENAVEIAAKILKISPEEKNNLIAFKIAFDVQKILLDPKFIQDVKMGRKTTTIRRGHRDYNPKKPAIFDSGQEIVPIEIESKKYLRFKQLTEEDAIKDGFTSARELKSELKQFYSDIKDDTPITILKFHLRKAKI